MRKRLLSFLLILCVLMSLVSSLAMADESISGSEELYEESLEETVEETNEEAADVELSDSLELEEVETVPAEEAVENQSKLTLNISPEKSAYDAGEEIVLTVNIANDGTEPVGLEITFDFAGFTVKSAESLIADGSSEFTSNYDRFIILSYTDAENQIEPVVADGDIAKITLIAPCQTESNTIEYTFKATVSEAIDMEEAEVVFEEATVQKSVTVNKEIVPLTGIELDESTIAVVKDETTTLTATKQPENTTDNGVITWTSSNESVATVENGVVTGVSMGTATITASCGGFSASCDVNVYCDHSRHCTKVAAKAATCTTAGNNEYYICNECGACFKDADCSIPTTAEEETLVYKPSVDVKTQEDCRAEVKDEEIKEALDEVVSQIGFGTEATDAESVAEAISESVPEEDVDAMAESISKAIEAGKEISVAIEMAEKKADTLSKEEKDLLEQNLVGTDNVVAAYLDISINLQADGEDIGRLTKLKSSVTITVELSDEEVRNLKKTSEGKNTRIYVARVHDGEVNLIPATLKDNILSFETDRFSLFSVVSSTYIGGDVTGDNTVDISDVIRLMKYITGENVTVNMAAADTSGNGVTDLLDIVRLLKYLCGDPVELK